MARWSTRPRPFSSTLEKRLSTMVSWSMHWAMRSLARPNSASSATADRALYTLMGLVLGRANCRGPSGPSTVMRRAFSSMALT